MSDPKRATFITVGAPKSAKNVVTNTVRLTINLVESNESKYTEVNYKELVSAEERPKKAVLSNGKTPGLDPFSDNDEDVERVAKKFEQKYGGKNTYGGKRKIRDEFADIGAGYDENDSFIDNTDGYDEMIPPEYDTLYGGFYINSGSLAFKNVPENQLPESDGEQIGSARNKRRLSSSSSDSRSSESSSESSRDETDTKPTANGDVDLHDSEHRKKKSTNDKKNAKRIRRADSSAATSGKQTSDDNAQGDAESADSRTSQSDSLTSKPAPSSENVVTSDSSRDVADNKQELPPPVYAVVEELKCHMARLQLATPNIAFKDIDATLDPFLVRLERALCSCPTHTQRYSWTLLSRLLNTTRVKLYQRAKRLASEATATAATTQPTPPPVTTTAATTTTSATTISSTPVSTTTTPTTTTNKRKRVEETDGPNLSLKGEEAIVDTLAKLHALIEERKPSMIADYKAECARIHEERKKQQACTEGAPKAERRLPKRRFPWCQRSRQLLHRLTMLAGPGQAAAATLLANRVLPLFPKGFVRMPTLLRQAEVKVSGHGELKRQRVGSTSQLPTVPASQAFTEPMQFPSSLTVTTHKAIPEITEPTSSEHKHKTDNVKSPIESQVGTILNTFSLNKDMLIEDRTKPKESDRGRTDSYLPPNSIGSITITPVNSNPKPEKTQVTKLSNSVTMSLYDKQKDSGMIRVKSPATLTKEANEIAKKDKDRHKVKDKTHTHSKDKRIDTPLEIDTNFQPKEKPNPSPSMKKDEQKMTEKRPNEDKIPRPATTEKRPNEDKIPRPALIPVQHSPTFAKPDKTRTEPKKRKEIVIISDLDPLENISEPVAIDDSDSDVEVIEVKTEKCETNTKNSDVKKLSDSVPSKDPSAKDCVIQPTGKVKERDGIKGKPVERRGEKMEVDEIDKVMRDLREMQDSQEPNYHSNGFADDIVRDRTSLNKMDGCSSSEVDVA